MLIRFGGHAMAAGLTIEQSKLVQFKTAFNEVIAQFIEPEQLQGVIYTDGELQAGEFSLETANLLRQAGPWGQHFAEPLFEGHFRILQQRLVGGKYLKMLLETENGMLLDAIWFTVDVRQFPDLSIKSAKIVYRLDINYFRGNENLQIFVEDLQTV